MKGSGSVAAIDCGTNSTRLLIVDRAGVTRVREMHVTRLGEGVDASRELSVPAMDRTLRVLKQFRATMDGESVARARLVATSAVRDALNGNEFLRAASRITGARAELLSGVEEGRLSYSGATMGLETVHSGTLVVDIGGGSTELIFGRIDQIHSISTELGCVRLTERYLAHDPPENGEIASVVEKIGTELDRVISRAPSLRRIRSDTRLIGLAGTVSTLVALELGLVEYQRELVHHATLTEQCVTHWCKLLSRESSAERAQRSGMSEGRQDVIVGGALVLREVMEIFQISECLVSESDILDGLILTMRQGTG